MHKVWGELSSTTRLEVRLAISAFLLMEVMTTRLKRTLIMARLISATTTTAPELVNVNKEMISPYI